METAVQVHSADVVLDADLTIPAHAAGIVVFAHGSGSSRHSSRNRRVARALQDAGLATLLLDLLTQEEEAVDVNTREYRFDIPRLAGRLCGVQEWLAAQNDTRALRTGYFGASTGAGAALIAAARAPDDIGAVVSRGGRPDLAGPALPRVAAPTLLIVGGDDLPVIELNREAMARMHAHVQLEIVPGASHLFEEPGTLERVAQLARDWFVRWLVPANRHS